MRILFIGNSHTFCNGLPFQVRELLRLGGLDAVVSMYATGGVRLGWHARQIETRMALQYQRWDLIILQQKSHPFNGYRLLRKDCLALLPLIRDETARILLFMTWAEKRFPENQAILDDAFTRLAHEIGAGLAPVSKAWRRVLKRERDIDLYQEDGEHASPAGSYLAACVFFAVLSGISPQGLPGRVSVGGDILSDLADDQAHRIQSAAWWTVKGQE